MAEPEAAQRRAADFDLTHRVGSFFERVTACMVDGKKQGTLRPGVSFPDVTRKDLGLGIEVKGFGNSEPFECPVSQLRNLSKADQSLPHTSYCLYSYKNRGRGEADRPAHIKEGGTYSWLARIRSTRALRTLLSSKCSEAFFLDISIVRQFEEIDGTRPGRRDQSRRVVALLRKRLRRFDSDGAVFMHELELDPSRWVVAKYDMDFPVKFGYSWYPMRFKLLSVLRPAVHAVISPVLSRRMYEPGVVPWDRKKAG